MIRICLADDQDLVRAGFGMVLGAQPDIEVVAEASDGDEVLPALARTPADLVLMDVRMPRVDGIEATRRVVAAHPEVKVVVLTTYDLDSAVTAAIAAGASGFLLKDVTPEYLVEAVRTVHRGDAVVDPASTRRLLRQAAPLLDRTAEPARLADLTPRERDVLTLIGQGLTNAEIAAEHVVSEATVKTHVGHILAKTGSRDRVQAVVLAFRTGLVR
ncbi:response regulator transcription factor [Pseudonocardia sp. WMMC193]|uniref:response regulator n=1 Tax=Pseudonocardia sp. WMMC193 TaxID=2911965 RepID=UPI001F1F2536|nr:response regulator transcription factor [Pseudonocardia sp. WMMC193]MCF7548820.1 response regulator transcription factor [Pseudonocardia sp. WMMC193]